MAHGHRRRTAGAYYASMGTFPSSPAWWLRRDDVSDEAGPLGSQPTKPAAVKDKRLHLSACRHPMDAQQEHLVVARGQLRFDRALEPNRCTINEPRRCARGVVGHPGSDGHCGRCVIAQHAPGRCRAGSGRAVLPSRAAARSTNCSARRTKPAAGPATPGMLTAMPWGSPSTSADTATTPLGKWANARRRPAPPDRGLELLRHC